MNRQTHTHTQTERMRGSTLKLLSNNFAIKMRTEFPKMNMNWRHEKCNMQVAKILRNVCGDVLILR